MVIHPVCGATKALIRLNANHMGQQVGSPLVWSKHTQARIVQIQRVRKSTVNGKALDYVLQAPLSAFYAMKNSDAFPCFKYVKGKPSPQPL